MLYSNKSQGFFLWIFLQKRRVILYVKPYKESHNKPSQFIYFEGKYSFADITLKWPQSSKVLVYRDHFIESVFFILSRKFWMQYIPRIWLHMEILDMTVNRPSKDHLRQYKKGWHLRVCVYPLKGQRMRWIVGAYNFQGQHTWIQNIAVTQTY